MEGEEPMRDSELLDGQVIDRKYRLARFICDRSFGWVYGADEPALGQRFRVERPRLAPSGASAARGDMC